MERADRTIQGTVFNIQKFSVNDGPGIRTVVFLKGCPLRCKWCANPESQLTKIQVLWDYKKCIKCRHCIDVCPKQAIRYTDDCIIIDHVKCNSCRQCVMECPQKAVKTEGEIKSVQEVLDIVLQDEVFYEESGGGITLSGGEMLAQPQFSMELLKAAKEEGLHTCCETTGYADPEVFKKIIENVDYVLFDMKHWNADKHKEGTGVTNELPICNMKYANAIGKEVLARIPVIPGFNDSLEDAKQLALLLKETGTKQCQLLPFHQFGENKYALLNKEYAYQNVNALHKEDLQEYLQIFLKQDINAYF